MSLRFIHELEEDIVDRSPDVRPQVQELAVNPVQGGLQEVALAGVFRVKEIQQL